MANIRFYYTFIWKNLLFLHFWGIDLPSERANAKQVHVNVEIYTLCINFGKDLTNIV